MTDNEVFDAFNDIVAASYSDHEYARLSIWTDATVASYMRGE